MSDEKHEQLGKCRFCGQTRMLETVGELSQDELDNMVTDLCYCPEADQLRRKKERQDRIDMFVADHFKGHIKDKIYEAIDEVTESGNGILEIGFKTADDMSIRVYVDSDYYLHIKAKVVDDYELKV